MSSLSTNISSFVYLSRLTHLHGLLITEIERRARPGNYSKCKIREKVKVMTLVTNEAKQVAHRSSRLREVRGQVGL